MAKKKPAKEQLPLFEAGTLWELKLPQSQKFPQLMSMMGKPIKVVDIGTLTALVQGSRNRFIRVIWRSNHTDRLYKTDEYKNCIITKVYCLIARNDFNFKKSVLAELKRRGASKEGKNWSPKPLSWGARVPSTAFSVYCVKDGHTGEPERLYAHLLPAFDRKGHQRYMSISGETGWYVNNVKTENEDEIDALVRDRKSPVTELDRARQKFHPVRVRLDDIMFIKIAGNWYRLKKPSHDDITAVKDCALEYAVSLEAAG